jgi:hypothetical protein
MATIPAPGAHPKPRVTVSPEALSGTRIALAGVFAGMLGFIFARIFAEPVINKAIAYESGRDSWLALLNKAAGRPVAPDGPEIFSRTVQSTVGIATGIIAFSAAMGALIAVAYLVLHGRFNVRPRNLVWMIAAFGFFGIYLLPFVKYPANPPAIGHTFTVATRAQLYLVMVASSLILLGLAVFGARRLMPRFGMVGAVVIAAVGVPGRVRRADRAAAVAGQPQCQRRQCGPVRLRPGLDRDSASDHQHLVGAAARGRQDHRPGPRSSTPDSMPTCCGSSAGTRSSTRR